MTKLKNKNIFFASLTFGLIFSILMSLCSFNAHCNTIRNSVLRIHILANSDSDSDQALKLKVRDELLVLSDNLFKNCSTREEAKKAAEENLDLFKSRAEEVIMQQGYNYPVNISVGKADFNTRHYEKFTLPAGTYDALRVVIGNGNGHNWWCVMFPPVCVPSAAGSEIGDALSGTDTEIVENETKYKCRFKVVEIYESLCSFLKDKFNF